jgi:hypothetical protein
LRKAAVAGEAMIADAHIQNTGQSEAVNVRARMRLMVNTALPEGPMPDIPEPPSAGTGVLDPQGKMSTDISTVSSLNVSAVTALKSRRAQVFVFGIVTYDTFGVRHETRFCFVPDPVNIQNALTCPKWNEAR